MGVEGVEKSISISCSYVFSDLDICFLAIVAMQSCMNACMHVDLHGNVCTYCMSNYV